MRNCFTKITNVFRKQARHKSSEEGSLQQEDDDVYTRKKTTNTEPTVANIETAKKSTLSGCLSLKTNDKHSGWDRRDGVGDNSEVAHTLNLSTQSIMDGDYEKHLQLRLSQRSSQSTMNEAKNDYNRRDALHANDGVYQQKQLRLLGRNVDEAEKGQLLYMEATPSPVSFAIDASPTNGSRRSFVADNKTNAMPTNYDKCNSNVAKTPEEMEYEAKVAAEFEDVMTPLPTTAKHIQFAFGRNLRPEIAEVIRSLDANALRINNLTVEDKFELLRRFDCAQQARRHGRGNNFVRSMPPPGHSIQIDLGLVGHEPDDPEDNPSDSSTEGVVLRRKHHQTPKEKSTSCLYERRLPKSPKLKLILESKWKETSNGSKTGIAFKEVNDNDVEVCIVDLIKIVRKHKCMN